MDSEVRTAMYNIINSTTGRYGLTAVVTLLFQLHDMTQGVTLRVEGTTGLQFIITINVVL